MKRGAFFAVLLAVTVILGCTPRERDFFDVFRAGYTAEVEGTLLGVAFSAGISAEAEGAITPVTVTFYAPETLSGTVLSRASDGAVTLYCNGISTGDLGGFGAALFSLFPTSGEVQRTMLGEEQHTVIVGDGFELEFLSDGTPYRAKNADASVTVISWQK